MLIFKSTIRHVGLGYFVENRQSVFSEYGLNLLADRITTCRISIPMPPPRGRQNNDRARLLHQFSE